jgi:hypothetical protein
VAITRAARKIDSIITRIGLNPAQTGGMGRGLPGILSYMVLRAISSNVVKAVGASAGGGASPQANAANRAGGPRTGLGGRAYSRANTNNRASTSNRANTSSQSVTQNTVDTQNTNVSHPSESGAAGTAQASQNTHGKGKSVNPPLSRSGQPGKGVSTGAAGTVPQGGKVSTSATRFSAVPQSARNTLDNRGTRGAAESGIISSTTRMQQGGMNVNADNRSILSQPPTGAAGTEDARSPVNVPQGNIPPASPQPGGPVSVTESRRTSVSTDRPPASAVSAPLTPLTPQPAASTGTAAAESRRSPPPSIGSSSPITLGAQRGGRNQPPPSQGVPPISGNPSGRQERPPSRSKINNGQPGRQVSGAQRHTRTARAAPTKPGVYTPKTRNNQSTVRINGLSNIGRPKGKGGKNNRKGKGK